MRAIELDANNLRIRSQGAWGLWGLGHKEAALNIWPFPDNLYDLVSFSTEFEYNLELAQEHDTRTDRE